MSTGIRESYSQLPLNHKTCPQWHSRQVGGYSVGHGGFIQGQSEAAVIQHSPSARRNHKRPQPLHQPRKGRPVHTASNSCGRKPPGKDFAFARRAGGNFIAAICRMIQSSLASPAKVSCHLDFSRPRKLSRKKVSPDVKCFVAFQYLLLNDSFSSRSNR